MAKGYLDNYYARLGVPKSASFDDVRFAYHQAARRLHPDSNKNPGAVELFLQVQEAYETLSNPAKREKYDKTLPDDIDNLPEILVNTIFSREILPIMSSPQLVYVLLDLLALPEPDEFHNKRPPINICLVLDTSTSMTGDRLDAVKSTATYLIKAMHPNDYFSMVTFNDRAETILPASRGLDYSFVQSRISIIHTSGGTEIFKGLMAAIDEIEKNRERVLLNHLILITDGRTYGDENKCLELADQANQNGITITCLGVGGDWNDQFLDDLAKRTGGSSAYADQPGKIQQILEEKFGLMQFTYANNVYFESTTPPNVQLRYAFRLLPDASSLGLDERINFGDIPLGRSLSILMEFYIEEVKKGTSSLTIADGELHFNIPSRPIPRISSRLTMTRPVAVDPQINPPPQVLVRAMSHLSLYRLQEQAQMELEEGKIEKATRRLNNLEANLLTSGQPKLAKTVRFELEKLIHGNALSEEGKKQIKYGTRSLINIPDEEKPR